MYLRVAWRFGKLEATNLRCSLLVHTRIHRCLDSMGIQYARDKTCCISMACAPAVPKELQYLAYASVQLLGLARSDMSVTPLLFDILRHVVQCSAVKSYRKPAITRILPP
jgi:hypothetical protein